MKKYIIFIAGLLVALCSFSGCNKQNTQEVVLSTYEEWVQMYMNVWVFHPKTEGEDVSLAEGEGAYYRKVCDERFQSLQDIKNATEAICTQSGAEKVYEYNLERDQYFREKNGNLYVLTAGIVVNFGTREELTEFTVLEERKDYIHAEMEFKKDDYKMIVDIVIVNENGKWLVDSLEEDYIG